MFHRPSGNKRKGQSTVEYILLVTAVIVVAVMFLVGKDSPFQKELNTSMNSMTMQMGNMVNRLSTP